MKLNLKPNFTLCSTITEKFLKDNGFSRHKLIGFKKRFEHTNIVVNIEDKRITISRLIAGNINGRIDITASDKLTVGDLYRALRVFRLDTIFD